MPDKREEIPDVVLRLARQQLAKESAASPGCEPFELAAAAGDRLSANKTSAESEYIDQRDAAQVPSGGAAPTADPPPLPPDTDFKLQNDNPSNLQFEICNFQFAIPTPPGPALRSGGAHDKRVNVDGASTETPRAEPTPNRAASDTDLLLAAAFDPRHGGAAARLPALPQDDTASAGPPPIPPLRKGGPGGVLSGAQDIQNGVEGGSTFGHPPAPAGEREVRSLVDSIDNHSRNFEETLTTLEQSLSQLFATQIEILNSLGESAREHERRWLEQTTTRRATYSV